MQLSGVTKGASRARQLNRIQASKNSEAQMYTRGEKNAISTLLRSLKLLNLYMNKRKTKTERYNVNQFSEESLVFDLWYERVIN